MMKIIFIAVYFEAARRRAKYSHARDGFKSRPRERAMICRLDLFGFDDVFLLVN